MLCIGLRLIVVVNQKRGIYSCLQKSEKRISENISEKRTNAGLNDVLLRVYSVPAEAIWRKWAGEMPA